MLAYPELRLRLRVLLALACAALITLAITPLVRRLACRIGAIDMPGEFRRIHKDPTPRLGGLGMLLAFCAATVLFAPMSREMAGILLGSVMIAMTGAIDDIYSMTPWVKLLLQCAAALVAVLFGVRIQLLAGLSGDFTLGWLTIPVTILWIVGVTNAINLLDGMDGLAAGVTGISCASTLAVSLFVPEATHAAVLLGALGGACLGFLPYNRNPARIFMGDTGSMLLGFVLATASVLGLFKSYALITCAVPLLTLALPIADTLFAIVRRTAHGRSPMQADRGHIHHRLMALGLSEKQVVWVLYGVSAVMGLTAVILAVQGVTRFWLILAAGILAAAVVLYFILGRRHRENRPGE